MKCDVTGCEADNGSWIDLENNGKCSRLLLCSNHYNEMMKAIDRIMGSEKERHCAIPSKVWKQIIEVQE